ncbi:LOW QUALITY PROTEIN: multidrug resistance-associated protein 1-like [Mya arenaria]|uniref:LOW QUALITY PROTEIN: multidrug resistance-associated protein 1-like n=1 Tax=Mya arenaria TaxID=6604 RepID=UPI0022DF964C|nr:LOW QUALITY PROTEIN: multidrug resistance-associated protein 1-like [Mya arenaria]
MESTISEIGGNSTLWGFDLFWDNPFSSVTYCFHYTLLTWIPCAVIWCYVAMVARTWYASGSGSLPSVPLSGLSLTKSILAFVLCCLNLVEMLHTHENSQTDETDSPSFYAACMIKAATYLLVSFFVQIARIHGVTFSRAMVNFWLLSAIVGLAPIYKRIIEEDMNGSRFKLECLAVATIMLEVLLSSIAESAQTKEKEPVDKKQCPEVRASLISRIFLLWVNQVITGVYKNGIKEDELWDLNPRDQADSFVPAFQNYWGKEIELFKIRQAKAKTTKDNEDEVSLISKKDKEHTKKPKDKKEKEKKNVMESDEKKDGPSLLKAIVKTFGRGFLYGWACKLAFDVFRLMEPMVLKSMIAYVEKRSGEASYGYGLALLLFLLGCLTNLLIHHCIRLCIVSSLRLKSGLIAMVYRKALSMNNEARKASTVGEIVNIMSVDCDRIAGISSWIWFLWSVPFSVTGTMVLLWHVVGPAVLPSIGIYALFMWFNAFVAKKNRQYEKEKMEQKDARIKLMNDILNGIKVLKLYAWEASFQKQIEELRAKESEAQRKNHMIGIMHNLMWFTVPMLCTGSVFGTFILMNPSSLLDAQKIFVTISLLNILQGEINILPHIVSHISEATVSIGRISKFLQNPDIDPKNVQRDNSTDKAVSIKSGTFSWNEKRKPTLKDINLDIEAGGLIAVVGQVGAGKSSLISALLGEMEKINGDVNVNGSVAYVPQQAWIQNASARDNILFCSPSDRTKYKKVVDGCALTSDFEIFKAGDLTEIGEKGINLSGGQKQRISLARAVYNNADVYLLDDPLSAVDSHVGKHIFNEVIGSEGLLRNKTRILVTHGVHWLPKVDKIVVLVNGQISEMGSYEQLLSHDGAFAKFLKAFVTTESSDEDSDKEVQTMKNEVYQRFESVTSNDGDSVSTNRKKHFKRTRSVIDNDELLATKPTFKGDEDEHIPSRPFNRRFSKLERSISNYDTIDSELWDESEDFEKKANLVEDETQETGKVSWKVYLSFLRAFGVVFTGIFLVLMLMVRTGEAASNLFLMQWSDDEFLTNTSNANTTEYSHRNYVYLGLYSVSGMFRGLMVSSVSFVMAIGSIRAARIMHEKLLDNVLKLPMSFFDTTPIGRIVNRFSKDVEAMDHVAGRIRGFSASILCVIYNVVIISYNLPAFGFVIGLVAIPFIVMLRVFVPTSRQLQRLESATKSPIFSHFSETLAGTSTIRGYCLEKRFIQDSQKSVDKHISFNFAREHVNWWLATKMDFFGDLMLLSACIFAVSAGNFTGGLVGFIINYTMMVTGSLKGIIWATGELETQAVSIERIVEYTNQKREADLIVESNRPPTGWPHTGNVTFKHFSTRYRDGLDLVVKGISCQIKGGERVGIVGRTGAGKSSLMVSIFRLIEAAGGDIEIDGVNLSEIGIHDLRSNLTILPQDPVLFCGTLRMNLDPFDHYTDEQIWTALEHSHLHKFVSGLEDGLKHECGEGGQNLSVGQRQMVCLTRSLLRKSKVLVLDEATAAVDMETDELIQRTIREEFKGCTILTIAHRLNTIMDYDKIMVLDNGLIKEFDSPKNLLADSTSTFYGMAKDSNLV